MVQGIGSALGTLRALSKQGQPASLQFADYLMPSALGLPDIEVHHIRTPSRVTPLGMKGLGESSAVGPAALWPMRSDALGVPVQERRTPNRVWELIRTRADRHRRSLASQQHQAALKFTQTFLILLIGGERLQSLHGRSRFV